MDLSLRMSILMAINLDDDTLFKEVVGLLNKLFSLMSKVSIQI
jgi:hypothetical protein